MPQIRVGAPSSIRAQPVRYVWCSLNYPCQSGLSSNFTFSFVAKFGGQGRGRAQSSQGQDQPRTRTGYVEIIELSTEVREIFKIFGEGPQGLVHKVNLNYYWWFV